MINFLVYSLLTFTIFFLTLILTLAIFWRIDINEEVWVDEFDLDDEALFGPSDNLLEEADIDEQDLDIYGLVTFNILSTKGGFFQKVRFVFQISKSQKKKFSKKLSWAWNLNFPPITVHCNWQENLKFKFPTNNSTL